MRLNIGTGATDPGWVSVDLFTPAADVQADMAGLPYEDGSVDAIRCSHALEHVGWREVPAVLAEWRRVLRQWGVLWVMVPTLDYCARFWASHEDDAWGMQLLFGSQERDGQTHRCGFTPTSLEAALRAAGFEIVCVETIWSHGQMCLVAEAFVA